MKFINKKKKIINKNWFENITKIALFDLIDIENNELNITDYLNIKKYLDIDNLNKKFENVLIVEENNKNGKGERI